jgi:DNA-binding transcriptional regulator PaaX
MGATEREVGDTAELSGTDSTSADAWLLLVYRIPSDPTRLRAAVWRRLKSLGAVYLQNSAAAMDGSAMLLTCSAVVDGQDIVALFQTARDSEYEEILDKCRDFHAGLEKEYVANHFTYGELEENEVELVKLRNWFAKVRARDVYAAPQRDAALQALDACETALETYATRVYAEQDEGG